jgi:hypothetical protein
VALYLAAHVAFRRRNVRSWSVQRMLAAAACTALVPLAVRLPALASLAAVSGVCTLLMTYEAIRFREARDRVRHGG